MTTAGMSDAERASPRFIVVSGSQSCHCCFVATVVDTTRPVTIGGKHYNGQFEPVCECFEYGDAEIIAAALNATVATDAGGWPTRE